MIELEQLFWGHDGGRYRLLGASSQASAEEAARIRDRLGTPGGLSEIRPFLLSVPAGDRLIMMCGQQGRRDDIGRKTLFFHTLIGSREECARHHVNAYALWKRGCFKGEFVDEGPVKPLSVQNLPEIRIPAQDGDPSWDGRKLAIRSDKPENEMVCRLLGDRINDVPWAGFSWNPLDDFLLYAISRNAAAPEDRPCHDLKTTTSGQPDPEMPRSSVSDSQKDEKMKISSRFPCFFLSILLVVSMGFNGWFVWRQHIQKESAPPASEKPAETEIGTEKAVTPKTEEAVKKSADERSLSPQSRFDWEREIRKTASIKSIWNDKDGRYYKREDREFLEEVKALIERNEK